MIKVALTDPPFKLAYKWNSLKLDIRNLRYHVGITGQH